MKISFKGFRAAFIQSLRTSWPIMLMVSILLLICNIIIPMMSTSSYALLYALKESDGKILSTLVETLFGREEILYNIMIFFVTVIAFFSVFFLFSYLRDRKSTDFYHSLPVTRFAQFSANILTGFLHLAIPLVATVAVSFVLMRIMIPFEIAETGYLFSTMVMYILRLLWVYLRMYAYATLSVILTGSFLSSGLMYIFILFFPICITMVTALFNGLFDGELEMIIFHDPVKFISISPFLRLYTAMEIPVATGEQILNIVSVILLFVVCALLLYIRKSENCKMPLAFEKVTDPYMFLICYGVSLVFGMIFMLANAYSIVWSIIGALLGMFISFILLNAVLEGNLKQVLHRPVRLPIFFGIFLILFAITAIEPIQLYKFSLPPASEVETANISPRWEPHIEGYNETKDDHYQQMILDIAEESTRLSYRDVVYSTYENYYRTTIRTNYTKDGRTFDTYEAWDPADLEAYLPLLKELHKADILSTSTEVCASTDSIVEFSASCETFATPQYVGYISDDEKESVSEKAVVTEDYTESDVRITVTSKAACDELMHAMLIDFEQAKLEDYGAPSVYTLRYTYQKENDYQSTRSFAVPQSFANTIEVIKRYCEVPDEQKIYISRADGIEYMEIIGADTGNTVKTVYDKAMIRKILRYAVTEGTAYQTEIFIQQLPYAVRAVHENGRYEIFYFGLAADFDTLFQ